jgi:ankyrin repeat protein
MLACQDGKLSLARFLLDHGADPDAGKHNGSTPLFKAAQAGHPEVVRLLLNAKAALDAPFASGCTAIGAAAGAGHEHCVKLLIFARADAEVVAHSDGKTPADIARAGGHPAIASLLAKPLVEPPAPVLLPGTRVSVHGIVAKPELNEQIATVLEFDGHSGRYALAMLKGGSAAGVALKPANISAVSETEPTEPMDVSDSNDASNGAVSGGAPPRTAATPIRPMEVWPMLMSGGNVVAHATELLRRGDFDLNHAFPALPNQSAGGKTTHLLAFAASACIKRWPGGDASASNLRPMSELLATLLESRADVNARTEAGSTALHLACANAQLGNVEAIMARGADANAVDRRGVSPLMCAVQREHGATGVAIVRALAKGGALVDQTDSEGYTSFVAAVEWGRERELLSALLEAGASVNAQTAVPGFTALAAAAAGNTTVDASIVEFLLEAKADATMTYVNPSLPHASKAQTPREWARLQGRTAVCAILDAALGEGDDLEQMATRARSLGLLEAAEYDATTARVASGEATKAEAARVLKERCEAHEARKLYMETMKRGWVARRTILDSLAPNCDMAKLAALVDKHAIEHPYPKGEEPTAGNLVQLQGLQGAPELNGQRGRVAGWNLDGRRRYTVRLDSRKLVTCAMTKAVAYDPPQYAFPSDFDCTSSEVVTALQADFDEASESGGAAKRLVLDWTPLAAKVADAVYLLQLAHSIVHIEDADEFAMKLVQDEVDAATAKAAAAKESGAKAAEVEAAEAEVEAAAAKLADMVEAAPKTAASSDALIFFMRTPETAPLFLAHREIMQPQHTMGASAASLAALPWLLCGKAVNTVPSAWEQCCKKDYIVRLCRNNQAMNFTCPVCHEGCRFADNPCQLPCAHFVCIACLQRISPPTSFQERTKGAAVSGMTCPVCRTHFPKHGLTEHPAAPGGVAIMEKV